MKTLIIAIACISVIAGCEPEVTAPQSWTERGTPEWIVPVEGTSIQGIAKAGGIIVYGGGSFAYPIALVSPGGAVHRIGPFEEVPHCGAVSPDGSTVALLYDYSIAFYDVERKIIVERIMSNLLPVSYVYVGMTFGSNSNDMYVFGYSNTVGSPSQPGALRLRVDRSKWLVEALPGHAARQKGAFGEGSLAPQPTLNKDHIRLNNTSYWILSTGKLRSLSTTALLGRSDTSEKVVLSNTADEWWILGESTVDHIDGAGRTDRHLKFDRYLPSGFTSVGSSRLYDVTRPKLSIDDKLLAYIELTIQGPWGPDAWNVVVWNLGSGKIVKRFAQESWIASTLEYRNQPVTLCFDSQDPNKLYSHSNGQLVQWRVR